MNSYQKLIMGIAGTIITALLIYPYVQLSDQNNRIIGLEKDRDYMKAIYEKDLKRLERGLRNETDR